MSFEQIEKFQCLKSSTTQGLSHGIFRTHMARVTCPETCLKGWQTLRSKKSKNRNYLVWQSIGSSCMPSQLSENIWHPYGGIFYNDWGHGGCVICSTYVTIKNIKNTKFDLLFQIFLINQNHFKSEMTEVYLGDYLYKFPSGDLSELSDHTLLYMEERWVKKRLIFKSSSLQRWDDLRTEMKDLGYLRIKGLNKREDVLGARRGDYMYIDL